MKYPIIIYTGNNVISVVFSYRKIYVNSTGFHFEELFPNNSITVDNIIIQGSSQTRQQRDGAGNIIHEEEVPCIRIFTEGFNTIVYV